MKCAGGTITDENEHLVKIEAEIQRSLIRS